MKLDSKKLNYVLIFLYLIGAIVTFLTLFQLPDDIVRTSQTISPSAIEAAQPAIVKFSAIVIITLVVGLIALVALSKNKSQDVIYVEKQRMKEAGDEGEDMHSANNGQLDTTFLNEILKEESDQQKLLDKTLTQICKKIEAGVGILYKYEAGDSNLLKMKSTYAVSLGESQTLSYEMGEGLVGQVARERRSLIVDDIPEGYIKVVSGLGNSSPTHLLILPIVEDSELYGVVEIASFTTLDKHHEAFVKECMTKIIDTIGGKEKGTKKTKSKATKSETDKSEDA